MSFDADAIERLLCGSTRQGLEVLGRDWGISQNKRQHGRQVGADHGRSLGETGDMIFRALHGDRPGAYLDARIGRKDRAGSMLEALHARIEPANGSSDAGFDGGHRKMPADDSSRTNQKLLRSAAYSLGGERSHPARVFKATCPGAGIGIAGADHNATRITARQSFPANPDRRGHDTVLGEDSRRGGGSIANHQCQVEAFWVWSNAAMNASIAIPVRETPTRCHLHLAARRRMKFRQDHGNLSELADEG